MAGTIRKPPTAFRKDKPKRATRGRKSVSIQQHRRWIKTLPSLITGTCGNVDCCHISMADPSAGKTSRGKAQKTDDYYVVPLSRALHNEIHDIGERRFQEKYGLDLIRIALALYTNSGNDDTAELIIGETKPSQLLPGKEQYT